MAVPFSQVKEDTPKSHRTKLTPSFSDVQEFRQSSEEMQRLTENNRVLLIIASMKGVFVVQDLLKT